MAGTGSLIEIHVHENFDVLELLSDVNGNLYYKNLPIFIQISDDEKNAITQTDKGIFVDSSYFLNKQQYQLLSKFSFVNGTLMYNNRIIAWEYTQEQLDTLNGQIWNSIDKEYEVPYSDIFTDSVKTSDNKVLITSNGKVLNTGGNANDS